MPELKHNNNPNFGSHFKELHERSLESHDILLEKEKLPKNLEGVIRFYSEKRPEMFWHYVKKMVETREIEPLANLFFFLYNGNQEQKKMGLSLVKAVLKEDKEVGSLLIEEIQKRNSSIKPKLDTKELDVSEEGRNSFTEEMKKKKLEAIKKEIAREEEREKLERDIESIKQKRLEEIRKEMERYRQMEELSKKEEKTKKEQPKEEGPKKPLPFRGKDTKDRLARTREIKDRIKKMYTDYGRLDWLKEEKMEEIAKILEDIEFQTNGEFDIEKLAKRDVINGISILLLRKKQELLRITDRAQIKDVTYHFGTLYTEIGDQRSYVCCYVTKNGETKLIVYYKSGSSTNWRLLPLVGDGGHYYKTEHGEEEINAPREIQKLLDSKKPIEVNEMIYEEFEVLSPSKNRIWSEKTGTLSEEERKEERKREKLIINNSIFVRDSKKIDLGEPGNLPDYSRIVDIWDSHSKVYGNTKKVCVLSRNGEYTWIFSSCKDGVFISGLEITGGEVSKHGLREIPDIFDSKTQMRYLLITQPREYKGQLLRRLERTEKYYRDNKDHSSADKIATIIGYYKKNVNQKDILFGEYVNVMPVLLLHPLIQEIQEPIRKIADRHK